MTTTTTDTTTTSTQLRTLADIIDAHPDLPPPYISAHAIVEAHWYLHVHGLMLDEQKATAATIIRILGGKWDKAERTYDDGLEFIQERDGLRLEVVVNRAAVCERVVIGTREVTMPAEPAIPKRAARRERVEMVEDVEWRCSSVLADAGVVLADAS